MGALACFCSRDAGDTVDDGSYPSEASTVVTGLTVHPKDAGDDVGLSSSDGSVGLLPNVDASAPTGDANPEASTVATGQRANEFEKSQGLAPTVIADRSYGWRFLPRGALLAATIAAASLTVGRVRVAMGEGAQEPIRLEYRAGSGCPDEASFVARVQERTERGRIAREGEQARTFRVELEDAPHPSGTVTVVDGARMEGTRTVDAGSCDEVADAMSLIVALALDPHARAPPPRPAIAAPSPIAGDAATATSLAPGSPAPLPSAAPPPPAKKEVDANVEPTEPPVTPAATVETRPNPLGLHFLGGADAAVATGVAPLTLFGFSPYLGWRSTGAARFGLSVRVAFLRIGTAPLAAPGGTADFTWTVGRVDACGLLRPDWPLRLGGCTRVELGALQGTGHGIAGAQGQVSPWIAAGILARFEWTFLGSLMLDLEAGPAFRLDSARFYFFPGITVYAVAPVGLDAEAGIGVHFL